MKIEAVRARYRDMQDRIAEAARRAGRDPAVIRLIVVTKAQPIEVIRAAVDAGARDLGENYAEEAVEKMAALEPAADLSWHMIGHVQSRKAPLVARHFAYLHSLDSLKLARRLERNLAEIGRELPVLLEYNVGGEATKYGWPAQDPLLWPDLLPEIGEILALPHLAVQGVMTVAPYHPDPEFARPYYRRLRALRDFLAEQYPAASWDELSIGMSNDFEVAIEEGATFVRVGEAILGPRP